MNILKYQRLLLIMLLFTFTSEVYRQVRRGAKKIKKLYFQDASYTIQNNLMIKFREKEQKKFVVVIASYNNENYCEKNLLSVFDQSYDNYRVIYINDCSQDKTIQKVRDFIAFKGFESRVELRNNSDRMGKMQNLFNAYQSCKNDEIIVCLDGDDALAHSNVFKELNAYYQNPNVWLTYGSAIVMPQAMILIPECFTDVEKKIGSMRKKPFDMHMLRTFYAGLFKKLKLKDLMFNGEFLPSADDVQVMTSLFEMAPEHALCLTDVSYIINDENPERTFRTYGAEESYIGQQVSSSAKKERLHKDFDPRADSFFNGSKFDVLLLGRVNEEDIDAICKSSKKIGKILIEAGANSKQLSDRYFQLERFDSKNCPLHQVVKKLPSKYLWIGSVDQIQAMTASQISNGLKSLEKTQVAALFMDMTSSILQYKLHISDHYNVLNTLTDKCIENYQGGLLLARQDLLKSLQKSKDESGSLIHQFLKEHQYDVFLCQKTP
jgi:glycosyltransferase involved in cell wall biosynthesis